MRIKVTSEGVYGQGRTRVANAETGETIKGVRAVRFEHRSPHDLPVLTLDVTDFDFECELAAAATVVRTPPDDRPPLMLIPDKALSMQGRENLRQELERLSCGPISVIEDGMKVYQILDGRWQPIDPSEIPLPQDILERDGIS